MKQAESGAPRQPGATQPEHEGVAHKPAQMTAAHIPLGGSVEHRLYSKAELTTLLERMARLVVQEAAKSICVYCSDGFQLMEHDGRWCHKEVTGEGRVHCYAWTIRALLIIFSAAKYWDALQKLAAE